MKRTSAAFAAAAIVMPAALVAQAIPGFDIERAYVVDSTRFVPFVATESRSLRGAIRAGVIHEDTPLLVLEHSAGTLALSMEQMAYHHAAQGEIEGEPWMVSF